MKAETRPIVTSPVHFKVMCEKKFHVYQFETWRRGNEQDLATVFFVDKNGRHNHAGILVM